MKATLFATVLVSSGALFAAASAQGPEPEPTHIIQLCPKDEPCVRKGKGISHSACIMDAVGQRYMVPTSTVVSCVPIKRKA